MPLWFTVLFVQRQELTRNKVDEGTLDDGVGGVWENQQLVVETLRRFWSIIKQGNTE